MIQQYVFINKQIYFSIKELPEPGVINLGATGVGNENEELHR